MRLSRICNKQWMFPNQRSSRVQGPQGMWTTSCRKWSNTFEKCDGVIGPRIKNVVGMQLRLGRSSKKEAREKLHHLTQQGTV
ncbi:hypothetical protein Godav_013654 [Gossypium davidsonii]|uniref:Uncharacterized protein n=1 Tax=Gossypium davidsonii TaxID=34287 RepID=A0A7J8RIG8_GOSDV|nr:hypothetical protein [Gossypium davidsonii]